MTTIRRLDVLSVAKVVGTIGAAVGLIAGAFVSLFAMIGFGLAAGATDEPGAGLIGLLFGAGAIIILPIFYGVISFIGGAIEAFIYNLVAKYVGGIQIELG